MLYGTHDLSCRLIDSQTACLPGVHDTMGSAAFVQGT